MSYTVKQESVILKFPIRTITSSDYYETITAALNYHRSVLDFALNQLTKRVSVVAKVATLLIETLQSGHKVFVAGNGGSATQAQHFAAELVGRFKRERRPFAVLSLTADTAILTAVANDYGYEDVFARQILGLGLPGDTLVAFSTSGESENLIRASQAAQQCQMTVIAVTGDRPSRLAQQSDVALCMPVNDTAISQELHLVVTHILCDLVESELTGYQGGAE